MQCQSPMSRGEFNGSRNVLTLLSVKMTERDMSPRASATRLSFHRLLRKGRASQAVAGWLATGPAGHVTPLDVISFQHPGRTIFYQWINERSFSCNELGFLWSSFVELHTLYPFTNPHNPAILLSPSRTPSPCSAVERCFPRLNSARLLCDGKVIFLYGKQAAFQVFLFEEVPSITSTSSSPKSSFLPAPHRPTLLLLATETHTHPGLMHFIKEAARGGQEFIGIHRCAIAARTDEKRPVAPFLSLIVFVLYSVFLSNRVRRVAPPEIARLSFVCSGS